MVIQPWAEQLQYKQDLLLSQIYNFDIYQQNLEVVLDAPGANDEHPTPFVEW